MNRQIGAGSGATGLRSLSYPYVNTQLPFKYGPGGEVIKPIIESAKHEREVAAGAWNGEKYAINQI